MDISNTASAASNMVKQETLLGAQVKLANTAKDQGQVIMDTLLSSINTVQPAASVEPHLGNKINTSA